MRKILGLTLLALLAIAPGGNAVDMNGKYSLGYFTSDTPVGGRYWIDSKIGIDLGLGFDIQDQGDETYTDFHIGTGLNYVVIDTDRANFMLRPGVNFSSLDARPYGIESESKWTRFRFSVMPVAEVFFGDNFSLSAGHGIQIETVSYPDEEEFGDLAGESRTNFKTIDGSISYLGFHFYFK
ncbi:MAG: hypothetical protein GF315_05900 [candidate division Zixibacteria bacterium]|nr:hypothetical protein [candidate division Zixibacteria bacterium]